MGYAEGYVRPQDQYDRARTAAASANSNMNPLLAINNAKKGYVQGTPYNPGVSAGPGFHEPTAEQRARFGGMADPSMRQPTAEQRERFGGMTQPGVQAQQWNPGQLGNMLSALPSGLPGQPASPQYSASSPLSASTGINPQSPYTQGDVNAAESGLRNTQLSMPQGFGGNGMQSLLNSATGTLAGTAASQFAPGASAALNQYDVGSQKAQSDALNSWNNLGANQLGQDIRFRQGQEGWMWGLLGQASSAPEYSY